MFGGFGFEEYLVNEHIKNHRDNFINKRIAVGLNSVRFSLLKSGDILSDDGLKELDNISSIEREKLLDDGFLINGRDIVTIDNIYSIIEYHFILVLINDFFFLWSKKTSNHRRDRTYITNFYVIFHSIRKICEEISSSSEDKFTSLFPDADIINNSIWMVLAILSYPLEGIDIISTTESFIG